MDGACPLEQSIEPFFPSLHQAETEDGFPRAAAKHGSGGLTLRHAAHIAGRVLVVSAAVALVALAVLAPLALLAALVAWASAAARRRRRERALDLA